jgi:REP element-mobilizing transposase RayT
MAVKHQFDETDEIYFVTITCFNWLNLFQITNFYTHIYDWFSFMVDSGKKIIGYVIMPNHLHLLLYIPENSEPINKVIGEGKRFMAYKMANILKEENYSELKNYLHNAVFKYERARGKKHQIFISNSDIRLCSNEDIIWEKLNYIHSNPVNGKWNLVDDFSKYIHSSASFYELNIEGIFPVTHYQDIIGY